MNDTSAPRKKRGCFKVGCCGCLAVVLLFVLGGSLWTGLGLLLQKEPEVARVERVHDIPRADGGSDVGDAGLPDLDPARLSGAGGTIVLDVRMAEFRIVPDEPGTPLRVSGSFDEAGYRLKESFAESGDGWEYKVEFDRKLGWFPSFNSGDNDNRIVLHIPRDTPFRLTGKAGVGSYRFELGGLAVRDVDLALGVGEHGIRFSEPLPLPMERLRLDASIGELDVRNIGNASPETVWVRQNIGEARIDLRGAWQRDADIDVGCGIGECSVSLPDDVNVDIRTSVAIGEGTGPGRRDEIEGAPWLRGRVRGRLGEVRAR